MPTVLGVATPGLGKGTMVASEKARLGTMRTKAKYAFGPSSLSGVSLWFLLSAQSSQAFAHTDHHWAKLAGEAWSSKCIDPGAKLTEKAIESQMVDIGTSAGWQKRG